ncbi:serine hydrolase domain-containing protein [Pseudogracilibacillus auburnensis]|uniref:CubicO group peptidase (Beta-lactamase class C family) n=1 Tax=Pseudogracilibacillus auburnensis TaxID=1494959 RepID=A0A2V3VUJ3_9BACI|nr:serine hydrolase domain-containing protein [Pseudogracilibacillus auburnensis]MBO1004670.1 beta-lactamase family protein [Pseudogracilibacillus auburnensis]PXW85577.1 CubicO group peptidase (beta-lactamase class C family) [Pseudogracilibacillus auburnensis]
MYSTYIEKLINQNKMPAAVLLIQKDGEMKFLKSYGSFKDNNNKDINVFTDTLFDLASLTKVIATLPSILLLHEEKELSIDDKVEKYIENFQYSNVRIRHLLQHTSGLPADLPYKNRNDQRDVISDIIQTKLIHDPGSKVNYSDVGMILLGRIIEKISGMGLDRFTQKYLFDPWKMKNTQYRPSPDKLNQIAATEMFEGEYIHGEVHDEKAYQLGGVCGSAGLFSTAKDVSAFANYWLYPESQSVLSKETMRLAVENIVGNRGLGFEVLNDTEKELTCGKRWSRGSFGHTGFTGTSVWIDPIEKLSVVLLTNIVHFGRDHQMRKFRKELHTMIYREFVKK